MNEAKPKEPKSTAYLMEKDKLHGAIQDAAKTGKTLRIRYINLQNEQQERNVEPYEIRGDKLWAYCRKKKGIRQFSLDRINHVQPTRYSYLPKWPVKIDDDTFKKTAAASFAQWAYAVGDCAFGSYEKAELE